MWIEVEQKNAKNILICGFYREWSRVGSRADHEQYINLEILSDQISRVSDERKTVIALGDANLDAMKWMNENYQHYKVAVTMKNILAQNGLTMKDVGNTFLAERKRKDGTKIESALDHVYVSRDKEESTRVIKSETSSTDHLPLMVKVHETKTAKAKQKVVTIRDMKNLTQETWTESLAKQEWETLAHTEDASKMAE